MRAPGKVKWSEFETVREHQYAAGRTKTQRARTDTKTEGPIDTGDGLLTACAYMRDYGSPKE